MARASKPSATAKGNSQKRRASSKTTRTASKRNKDNHSSKTTASTSKKDKDSKAAQTHKPCYAATPENELAKELVPVACQALIKKYFEANTREHKTKRRKLREHYKLSNSQFRTLAARNRGERVDYSTIAGNTNFESFAGHPEELARHEPMLLSELKIAYEEDRARCEAASVPVEVQRQEISETITSWLKDELRNFLQQEREASGEQLKSLLEGAHEAARSQNIDKDVIEQIKVEQKRLTGELAAGRRKKKAEKQKLKDQIVKQEAQTKDLNTVTEDLQATRQLLSSYSVENGRLKGRIGDLELKLDSYVRSGMMEGKIVALTDKYGKFGDGDLTTMNDKRKFIQRRIEGSTREMR
ncbi:hypothetical protein PC123_g15682 [Phytophthora cactorum]|nr:hypothetical protein PC123_g15682 [Phytophthora cactorum]